MAEIKSTLELIMEKTKNLTFTDEEKKALRKKEVQGKIRGFISKFMDGMMNLETLGHSIASFEEADHLAVKEVVVNECLSRIDPETDNAKIFDILKHVAGVDITALQKFLSDFLKELDHARAIREQELSERIQEKGFSGSAVLPNLKADPEWTHFVQKVKTRFRKELHGLAQQWMRL